MSVHLRPVRSLIIGLIFCDCAGPRGLCTGAPEPQNKEHAPTAATQPDDPAAAEDARERRSMERFLSLLEKNPRRGTPLDRVYGYHVERGSLDAFIKSIAIASTRIPTTALPGSSSGLLEFQRGQDAAAVTALNQSRRHTAQTTPCPPSISARPSS